MACQNQDLINIQIKTTAPNIIQPIVTVNVLKDEPAVKQENIINGNPGIILSISYIQIKIYNGTSAELIENYLEHPANELMKISCHFLMKLKRIVIQKLQNQNLKEYFIQERKHQLIRVKMIIFQL